MVMYTSEPVVTERSVPRDRPADRLLAQRTLFAGPSPEAPDELYAVVVRGVMVRERGRVILDGHAAVHTNTFFGRFPASYWQRWTSVRVGGVRRRRQWLGPAPDHGLRRRGRPRAPSRPTTWRTATPSPCS